MCCASHPQDLQRLLGVLAESLRLVLPLADRVWCLAQPNGICCVSTPQDLQRLLSATPARRLPQCGGKDAQLFQQAGIQTVADLQVQHCRTVVGVEAGLRCQPQAALDCPSAGWDAPCRRHCLHPSHVAWPD